LKKIHFCKAEALWKHHALEREYAKKYLITMYFILSCIQHNTPQPHSMVCPQVVDGRTVSIYGEYLKILTMLSRTNDKWSFSGLGVGHDAKTLHHRNVTKQYKSLRLTRIL
jgi:hypothetical protein